MRDYVATMLERCFNMAGMRVVHSGQYGGWDPNPDSEILHLLKTIYKEQNNEDALVQVDHAGLECSVILGKYPNMDVISLGPTLRSPHTTNNWREIRHFSGETKLISSYIIKKALHRRFFSLQRFIYLI